MDTVKDFIHNRCEDTRRIWQALIERIIYSLNPRNDEVDYLRQLVEDERRDKKELINLLNAPHFEEDIVPPDIKPINTFKPFRVIRAELERKHREQQKVDIVIEGLEKELEVK